MRGITGRLSKHNLPQRSCEGHHAFVVAIAYGVQLLEREPSNAAGRYHSNQQHIASDCIASDCIASNGK